MAIKDLVFHLGFGTFCTHELDAMLNHEWRVLPLIRDLSEQTGMTLFVVLHIPFFAILVAMISSENHRIRHSSRLGVMLFLIAHGVLHILFRVHPLYEFSNLLSSSLIYGALISGVIYLTLAWKGSSKYTI